MLKTLAAHGVGCPAAGQDLETGQLSRHYKAEISLNVTLNHNQPAIIFHMYVHYGKSFSLVHKFQSNDLDLFVFLTTREI